MRAWVVTAAAALLLAACGAKDGRSAPTAAHVSLATLNVCALLTAEDVARAAGEPFLNGREDVVSGVVMTKRCSWVAAAPVAAATPASVLVEVSVWPSEAELTRAFSAGLFSGGPLAGVGDQALWNGSSLTARTGAVQLNVRIADSAHINAADLQAKTISLAQSALKQLHKT